MAVKESEAYEALAIFTLGRCRIGSVSIPDSAIDCPQKVELLLCSTKASVGAPTRRAGSSECATS